MRHPHELIRERLAPHFEELARCQSTPELEAHPRYLELLAEIGAVLETVERGGRRREPEAPASAYRVVAWNLERGIQVDGQIAEFRSHEHLRNADLLLLTETDVGMARSGNRNIASEIAAALDYEFVFSPCYLNLTKGSGVEYDVAGRNELGLHGNAILSRHPIRRAWPIHLKNGKDKMKGREKRIGRQTALAAEVELPGMELTAVSVHLDANSTQAHRCGQMRDVLQGIGEASPAVIGGDWNTTTYNSSSAFHAIMGFWLRVFMGVDNVIHNHYLHPYARFEKELFGMLEGTGFDYRQSNAIGEYTFSYNFHDPRTRKNLGEWVPGWCFPFIDWALKNHGGKCPLKLDWFATRGIDVSAPRVIHDLREGRDTPLSDHDAVTIDIAARRA